jgi:hypothetical protein
MEQMCTLLTFRAKGLGLFEHGANARAVDNSDQTIVDLVRNSNYYVFRSYAVCSFLEKHGAERTGVFEIRTIYASDDTVTPSLSRKPAAGSWTALGSQCFFRRPVIFRHSTAPTYDESYVTYISAQLLSSCQVTECNMLEGEGEGEGGGG